MNLLSFLIICCPDGSTRATNNITCKNSQQFCRTRGCPPCVLGVDNMYRGACVDEAESFCESAGGFTGVKLLARACPGGPATAALAIMPLLSSWGLLSRAVDGLRAPMSPKDGSPSAFVSSLSISSVFVGGDSLVNHSSEMGVRKRRTGGKRAHSRSPVRDGDVNHFLKHGRSPSPNRSRRPTSTPPKRNNLLNGSPTPQVCLRQFGRDYGTLPFLTFFMGPHGQFDTYYPVGSGFGHGLTRMRVQRRRHSLDGLPDGPSSRTRSQKSLTSTFFSLEDIVRTESFDTLMQSLIKGKVSITGSRGNYVCFPSLALVFGRLSFSDCGRYGFFGGASTRMKCVCDLVKPCLTFEMAG
jgi:hypothetical protein